MPHGELWQCFLTHSSMYFTPPDCSSDEIRLSRFSSVSPHSLPYPLLQLGSRPNWTNCSDMAKSVVLPVAGEACGAGWGPQQYRGGRGQDSRAIGSTNAPFSCSLALHTALRDLNYGGVYDGSDLEARAHSTHAVYWLLSSCRMCGFGRKGRRLLAPLFIQGLC